MDKLAIRKKTDELNTILLQYKSDLGALEKELLVAIADYHAALKEEKLKELKEGMLQH